MNQTMQKPEKSPLINTRKRKSFNDVKSDEPVAKRTRSTGTVTSEDTRVTRSQITLSRKKEKLFQGQKCFGSSKTELKTKDNLKTPTRRSAGRHGLKGTQNRNNAQKQGKSESNYWDISKKAHIDVCNDDLGNERFTTAAMMIWRKKLGRNIRDLCWDNREPFLWVRNGFDGADENYLVKFSNKLKGRLLCEMKIPCTHQSGGICIDSDLDCLLAGNHKGVVGFVCLSKKGQVINTLDIEDKGGIFGVTYCKENNSYIASDYCKGSAIHIVQKTTKACSTEYSPTKKKRGASTRTCYFVYYHAPAKQQPILVQSDFWSSEILILSCDGIFIRSIGSKGSGEFEFNCPSGIAGDSNGRIYICDKDNERVVRFDPYTLTGWEVLLGPGNTGEKAPWCISISPDDRLMAVGMHGREAELCVYELK